MQMYDDLTAADQQSAVNVDVPLDVAIDCANSANSANVVINEENTVIGSTSEEPQVMNSSDPSVSIVCENEDQEHHLVEDEILMSTSSLPSTPIACPSSSSSSSPSPSDNSPTTMQMDEMLDKCDSIPPSMEVVNGHEDVTTEEMEIILSLLPKEDEEEEEKVKTSDELFSSTEQEYPSSLSSLPTSIRPDPLPVNAMQEENPSEEHVEEPSSIEESHSHLVVYHKMVLSDSESCSGQSSPEHHQLPSQLRSIHSDNQVLKEVDSVSSIPPPTESEGLNPIVMDELPVKECSSPSPSSSSLLMQVENTEIPTHSSPPPPLLDSTSTLAFPLSTPPRSTVKRFASDQFTFIQNDSPDCSPSKVIATALPVLPVNLNLNSNSTYSERQDHPSLSSTPTSSSSSSQLKSIERSPTKVVMEEEERQLSSPSADNSMFNLFSSTPYSSSHFTPLTEVGQPLSTRLRRLLAQQADERSRFQQLLCCQTKGLYSSFLTDRQHCKVGVKCL